MSTSATDSAAQGFRYWGRRLLPFLAPFRSGIVALTGLTVVVTALDAVEPLLLKYVFDGLVGDDPAASLAVGIAALATLYLGRMLLGWVQNYTSWRTRIGIHYRLQRAVVDRVYSLPLAYHQRESVGSMTTRMERGVGGVVGALWSIVSGTVPSLLYLGFAMTAMFLLDWRLFLLVLVFTPLPALLGAWAARERTAREFRLLRHWQAVNARLHETLAGITTVESFARETTERRRFMRQVARTNRTVLRGVARDTTVGTVDATICHAARLCALAFGGFLVLRGETTIGTVIAFYGYIGGLFGPVQGLTGIYQTIRSARASLETIFEILDAPDPLADRPDAIALHDVRGEVEFENVDFSYRVGEPVIEGVSLRVTAGETIALVGSSGAGKTTLMNLLERFYDPDGGAILMDGIDLRTIRKRSLRRNIGVVLQDNLLFAGTIRDNIAFGRPEATLEDIEVAARLANAHDFVTAFPLGYDTEVGERGTHLSMGQRQRIAIARALLKNAPILILDEATSALDAETEARVQEALERLVKGRTTFLIAHRLSTIRRADRIVVVRSGRIVEIGTHDELMAVGGEYAQLVQRQASPDGRLFGPIGVVGQVGSG